jgi:hypothetical protein
LPRQHLLSIVPSIRIAVMVRSPETIVESARFDRIHKLLMGGGVVGAVVVLVLVPAALCVA